jgi:O-antigen/teichoic acid export membrane protein
MNFLLDGGSVLLQLSFAMPIALTNSIESISRWLDKLVVSLFLGTEPLGIYTVGAIEIPFVSVFVSSVFAIYSPMISDCDHRRDHASVLNILRHATAFTAKAIWPLFIYLLVFADHLVPWVFTHDYDASVLPFRIYLLMLPVRIMLYGVVLIALGRPRIVLYGAAGAFVIDFVLNLVLIRWIGFLGPAIATVVSTYFEVGFMFWYILRRLGARVRDVLPLVTLFDITLAALVGAAVAYLLTSAFLDDTRVVLSALTIMFGAYIFVGSRLGLFRILNPLDLLRGNIFGKRD